jgi:hypothetical protein
MKITVVADRAGRIVSSAHHAPGRTSSMEPTDSTHRWMTNRAQVNGQERSPPASPPGASIGVRSAGRLRGREVAPRSSDALRRSAAAITGSCCLGHMGHFETKRPNRPHNLANLPGQWIDASDFSDGEVAEPLHVFVDMLSLITRLRARPRQYEARGGARCGKQRGKRCVPAGAQAARFGLSATFNRTLRSVCRRRTGCTLAKQESRERS